MESTAEIEVKLGQYHSQLDQVGQLLTLDPENAQFLKLKEDLEQVIELTTALLVQRLNPNEGNVDEASGPSSNAKTSAANAHDGSDQGDEQYSLGDVSEDDSASSPAARKPLKIGDRVEVTGGEFPFPAVVTGIINETEFTVKYFAYDSEVSLPLSCLQPLAGTGTLKPSEIQIGGQYQCKYPMDGQFYTVEVQEQTPRGVRVKWVEYNTSEEVPLEYLRPIMVLSKANPDASQSSAGTKQAGEKGAKKTEAGKLIPIPPKLKILPTDTEEEKQRKYKKIKAIKQKNRLIEQETEVAQVAQTWHKFMNKKAVKRSIAGVLPKGSSIFSSSEEVTSKLGVANSGKGMTAFIERKKHKFEHVDD